VAAALLVGASSEQQILADYTSMKTKIPAEFRAELKAKHLIEQNAPTPPHQAENRDVGVRPNPLQRAESHISIKGLGTRFGTEDGAFTSGR
jgi:hypothetical protein